MKFLSVFAVASVLNFRNVFALPNIIVMQPDDLQFYDEWGPPPNNPSTPTETLKMPLNGLPNMEFLRNNGLQMMQAYTVSPMCGTSRYSTITGKYPSRAASSRRTNTNDNEDIGKVTIPTTKLQDVRTQPNKDCTEENLAVTFQKEGYRTGMIGKWHLSRFRSYTYSGAQETVQGCGFDYVEALYVENLASEGGFNSYSDGSFSHNMEWVTAEAITFINESSSTEQPFFLYFNPTVPHGSNDIRDALVDFTCRDVASGKLDSDPMIEGMTLEYGNCIDYRQSVLDRAESDDDLGPIWVDDSIGALLKALKNNGILDNTIFLFQQDHGMDTKSAIYETGTRIAQFIHYPDKIVGGTQLHSPVATIDIGPTLLDFAGIDPSPYYSMDGTSWREAMSNPIFESYLNNRCLFFELEQDRAVRCGCDKYLRIYDTNELISTTYSRGDQHGLSNDLDNVFDLCGGTDEYITDPETNMEATNLHSINSEKDSNLSDLLDCHLARTDHKSDPDFSDCTIPTTSPTPAPIKLTTISPTSDPTPASPTVTSCSDSTLRFRLTWNGKKISRGCTWVANKSTNLRCAVEGVSEHCPNACSSCSTCKDSTVRFKLAWNDKKISRGCTWVANKSTNLRCAVEGVSDSCRSTCGTC